MLSHLRLDEITEQHLLELIENKIPESHTLEYKRETYKKNDKGKKELLKDLAAFANADGGDLIIGIAENEDGVATALTGIEKAKIGQELERLEQIARSNFEPKIEFQMREISLSGDKVALIFRIPASEIGPHRETFNGINRFHVRGSKTTDEPDVEGLRKMFLAPYLREQKIREFVDERLENISKGNGPIPLRGNDFFAIHIVPFRTHHVRFGYAPLTQRHICQTFYPISASSWDYRANLDGVLLHSMEAHAARSYFQIFRNGSIESVCCGFAREANGYYTVQWTWLVKELIEATYRYVNSITNLGVNYPYVIFWSLHGLNNVRPIFGNEFYTGSSAKPFDRDRIYLPELQINEFSDIDDARQKLRPSLDTLWQSVGYDRCLYFDDNGDWNPPS